MGSIGLQREAVLGGIETRAVPDPLLSRIAQYLAGHRSRAAIDPTAIDPDLLPYFFVLQVDATGTAPRLRIRLTGTALDLAFGRCLKGSHMEDFLHGRHSADVLAGFHRCAASNEALWMRQVVKIKERVPRFVEGIAFPVDPGLIYGGLVFGEVTGGSSANSFELRSLMCRADLSRE